jgi:hypothetical protein
METDLGGEMTGIRRKLSRLRARARRRPRSLRYTLAYDEEGVRLLRRTPRTRTARPADDERRAARELAVTAELRDAEGRTLFRRVLEDPFPHALDFPTGEGYQSAEGPESGVITFVAPYDERYRELVVLGGSAVSPRQRAFREARELEGERTVLARLGAQAPARAALLAPVIPVTTKVVDNTPSAIGFNVVVMGDGYTAAELTDFADDADSLVDFQGGLRHTAPFDRYWQDVNVYRIDVASAASGVDRPATNHYVDTYFDGTYGANANMERLVTVNQQTVVDLADQEVSNWDALVVIVNSRDTSIQGGSGGAPVAVYTAHAAADTGVHEIGHATFGLGDEYDYYTSCELDPVSYNEYTGAEPIYPNVSATADRALIEWADQIEAATPMPTSVNPDPTTCDDRTLAEIDPALTTTTVGAFDGAGHYKSGLYRPAYDCRMRSELSSGQPVPFCPVCESVIETRLRAVFSAGSEDLCFVATAVYGDALHPDVVALRTWRDRHLARGARGRTAMRILVAVYGVVGPPLARFTRRRPRLANAVRALLEPLARRLR